MALEYAVKVGEKFVSLFKPQRKISLLALPVGSESTNFTVTLAVEARNRLNMVSRAQVQAQVLPPSRQVSVSTEVLQSEFSRLNRSLAGTGDVDGFMQAMTSVNSFLNLAESTANATAREEARQIRSQVREKMMESLADLSSSRDFSQEWRLTQISIAAGIIQEPSEVKSQVATSAMNVVARNLEFALGSVGSQHSDEFALTAFRFAAHSSAVLQAMQEQAESQSLSNATRVLGVDLHQLTETIASLALSHQDPGKPALNLQSELLELNVARTYLHELKLSPSDQPSPAQFTLPSDFVSRLVQSSADKDLSLSSVSVVRLVSLVNIFASLEQRHQDVMQWSRSPLISLSIHDDAGHEIPVNGLSSRISFRLALNQSVVPHGLVRERRCEFWNETSKGWSTQGCKVNEIASTFGTLVCECSHLTMFSARSEDALPRIRSVDASVLTWSNLLDHPTTLFALAALWSTFFVTFYYAYRKDQRELSKVDAAEKYKDAKVIRQETSDSAVLANAPLVRQEAWTRNTLHPTEVGGSFFSHNLTEQDKLLVMTTGGKGLENAGPVECEGGSSSAPCTPRAGDTGETGTVVNINPNPEKPAERKSFCQAVKERMYEDHQWISIVTRKPLAVKYYTSVQRLLTLTSVVFAALLSNAIFVADTSNVFANLLVILGTGAIMLPLGVVFVLVFERSSHTYQTTPSSQGRCQRIYFVLVKKPLPTKVNRWCSIVMVLWMITASYLILLYGIQFDLDQTQFSDDSGSLPSLVTVSGKSSVRWIVCTMLTVAQHAIIEQPGRIIAICIWASLTTVQALLGLRFIGGWR